MLRYQMIDITDKVKIFSCNKSKLRGLSNNFLKYVICLFAYFNLKCRYDASLFCIDNIIFKFSDA